MIFEVQKKFLRLSKKYCSDRKKYNQEIQLMIGKLVEFGCDDTLHFEYFIEDEFQKIKDHVLEKSVDLIRCTVSSLLNEVHSILKKPDPIRKINIYIQNRFKSQVNPINYIDYYQILNMIQTIRFDVETFSREYLQQINFNDRKELIKKAKKLIKKLDQKTKQCPVKCPLCGARCAKPHNHTDKSDNAEGLKHHTPIHIPTVFLSKCIFRHNR